MIASRLIRTALVAAVAVGTIAAVAPSAGAASQTYTVKVDGQPPTGEPWAFLRFFPAPSISVHQGDVVDFAFSATDTPHTVTLTGDADPAAWRGTNQAPGGPYEVFGPDSKFGGDNQSLVLNPAVGAPSDPTCGTSANPCKFDSTKVVNSGIQFPNSPQPAFFVAVTAPVGSYSFLCLLHPGMEVKLTVADAATTIPTPQQVSNSAAQQLKQTTKIDGSAADEMAQTVKKEWTLRSARQDQRRRVRERRQREPVPGQGRQGSRRRPCPVHRDARDPHGDLPEVRGRRPEVRVPPDVLRTGGRGRARPVPRRLFRPDEVRDRRESTRGGPDQEPEAGRPIRIQELRTPGTGYERDVPREEAGNLHVRLPGPRAGDEQHDQDRRVIREAPRELRLPRCPTSSARTMPYWYEPRADEPASTSDTITPSGSAPQYESPSPTLPKKSINNHVAGNVAIRKIPNATSSALNIVPPS